MDKLDCFKAKARDLARSGYFYGLPPLELSLGSTRLASGLINPRIRKNWNVFAKSLERSTKQHNRAAVRCRAIDCKFSLGSAPACN